MPETPVIDSPKPTEDKLARLKMAIVSEFNLFELSFRQRQPWLWWATLVGPFLITFALMFVLAITQGVAFVGKLAWTATIAFFFFGRFIILAGNDSETQAIHQFLSAEQLFAMLTYLDMMVALLLSFHMGFLFKIPVLGPKASDLVADGQFILHHQPWIRRLTFIGLVAFVIFPVAATGSVGGTIFGRLLGMSRVATMTGIFIGSMLGNGLMYFGADLVSTYFNRDDPLVKYGGLAAIVILILVMERWYRYIKQKTIAQWMDDESSSDTR